MRQIIEQIQYKPNWNILFFEGTERPYIQLKVLGNCSITGDLVPWVSGKRFLSYFMSNQEIVGSVFALIKDAEDHEMREFFRYKGKAIYNPHLDPDKLAEFASKKENFNYRKNSMGEA